MATPTLTSAFFRRIARLGSTKASSKGELLASVSAVWFLIFLLVPILIVVFFGFTTVNQDLTISYSRLTGANYLGALDPFGPVATLFVRTLGVAFLAAVGSLVIAFPIAYYLARVCRERNRGLLVSLFVIPFWISFVVQVYAVLPWVRRDGYVGMVLDRIGLGSLADWIFKAVEFGTLPDGAAESVVVLVPTIVLLYVYVAYAQAPATGLARESVVARFVRGAWGRLSALLARLPIAKKRTSAGDAAGGPDPPRTIRVYRSRPEQLVDSIASWRGPGILRAYTFVALAAFYTPLIQVIIFSFNHDNNTIVWSYPSLRWYVSPPGYQEVSSLFGDTAMIGALSNSIGIGLVVTAISLAIGLPAALAIVRYRFSSKPFLNLMLYTGLMIPSIILGLSLLVFIRLVDDLYLWPYLGVAWDFGYASIIVGHVTFCIPIVIVVLIVSLREFDRSIEEAAMDLGANEITTFFRVTIPNIMPGIVSAALLAFTFSFSEA